MRRSRDGSILLPAVTGVGSLPHTDAGQAVEFVARYAPEVPFWPQLPNRGGYEGMIEQSLARPSEDSMAGFFAFEHALEEGLFPEAAILKAQGTGPVTLARAAGMAGAEALRASLDLAIWQIERLKHFRLPVLYVLDEPFLPEGTATLVRQAVAEIRAAGAIAGVHCCADAALPAIEDCEADLISFDAERFAAGAAFNWPGLVALGIDGAEIPAPFERGDLGPRALITASCGLAGFSIQQASAAFERAHRLAGRMRAIGTG